MCDECKNVWYQLCDCDIKMIIQDMPYDIKLTEEEMKRVKDMAGDGMGWKDAIETAIDHVMYERKAQRLIKNPKTTLQKS